MKKGLHLSKATNLAKFNQEIKLIKEQERKERQRIRKSTGSTRNKPKATRRSSTKYSNKYTYTPSSPDFVNKILDGIWDCIFLIFKKISQKIFR